MKIPLRYQITKFDCGPTTLTNAVSYLFEREEIPCEILKGIYHYTLDMFGTNGISTGTSRPAMNHLSHWINEFSKIHKFPLVCDWRGGSSINSEYIKKELQENTVIVARVWSYYEHYVLITKIEKEYVYLFDPYYEVAKTYESDKEIEVITDNNQYNRKVNINRLDLIDSSKDYTLGSNRTRECITIRRKNNE